MTVSKENIQSTRELTIQEEILAVLKKRAQAEFEYINPQFLLEIANLIETYTGLADDEVDKWIMDMFSA